MSDEFLGDRRRALEESFFAKRDRELLEKLRRDMAAMECKQALAAASGIHDEAVLDALAASGIEAQTVAALSLAPLVEVAWAEGFIADKERKAILNAAHAHGITEGSAADDLLKQWLVSKPGPELFAAWKEYVAALRASSEPQAFATLRDDILDRAERVAQAAGGFLGAAAVSSKEKAVLAELEKAFKG